jgi:hypothetical protein
MSNEIQDILRVAQDWTIKFLEKKEDNEKKRK